MHTATHEMNKVQLRGLIMLFTEELRGLNGINQGCGGCVHSEHRGNGTCTFWKQTVPVEARAVGCDSWSYDEVPF